MISTAPPYDEAAEQALLGSLLLPEPPSVEVSADDFYQTSHRLVFSAICTVRGRGAEPEPVAVRAELERTGKLDEAGGADYLLNLVEKVPTAANADYYAGIVREKARRRELDRLGMVLQRAARDSAKPLEELESLLAGGTKARDIRSAASERLDWRPFPARVLPRTLRRFVEDTARNIGCDPAHVALPLLAVCAGLIGNTRRLRLKATWEVPCILWALTVGRSGTKKSPPYRAVLKVVHRLQAREMKKWQQAMEAHAQKLATYKARLREFERGGGDGAAPVQPPEPPCVHYVVDDVTTEAIAPLLETNPRGVTLAKDEAGAWIKTFDAYRPGGRGADRERWIEAWEGGTWKIDRKSGEKRTCFIPRVAVSATGTIQPGTLRSVLSPEFFESGFSARLLLAMPPAPAKTWSDDDPASSGSEDALEVLLTALAELEFGTDESGSAVPVLLDLTPEARADWARFYNDWNEAGGDDGDDEAAARAKLEHTAARFALLFHVVRQAACETVSPDVDADDIRAAVELTRWFAHETRRVYQALKESPKDTDRRKLLDRVEALGGMATANDLRRYFPRRFRDAESARAALAELVSAGYGTWTDRSGPGPKSDLFRLHRVYESTNSETTPEPTVPRGNSVEEPDSETRRFVDAGEVGGVL